jgi:hypothetical protein
MVERAVDETALDDFGSWAWSDGLHVIVESARSEADLNPIGVDVLRGWVHERLTNRLRVIDWVTRHPDVRDVRVEKPLVVAGMLRTGTTLLLELLACDPASRPLMKWEALDAVPPPEPDMLRADARIAKWVDIMEATYSVVPELKAVHWEPGDGPTECVALLGQAFRSQDWLGLFHLPTYVDWYLAADLEPAYRYHHLALQELGSRAGGRWVLKAPAHLLALDTLYAVYPDARLVVTHRDPRRTVASSVSLSTTSTPDTLTNDLDTSSWWGPLWLRMLGAMTDGLVDFRQRRPEVSVADVHFAELAADPIAVVETIYQTFGDTLTTDAEAAMVEHLRTHPRGHHGPHRYSLADAGLTESQVDERFATYRDRFGVTIEAAT